MSRCVCFLFLHPGEGGGLSYRPNNQPTERPTDRLNDAAPGASEGHSHVLICFIILFFLKLSKLGLTEPLPAMPSNSPAAAEPPKTLENDTANDVVREIDYRLYEVCFLRVCKILLE